MTRFADGLAGQYSAAAEDNSQGKESREAAMLFAVAESCLEKDEDHQQALQAAKDALSLFKEAGQADAAVDTMRLLIHAYKLKAEFIRFTETKGEEDAESTLQEAEKKAKEEETKLRKSGDKRGQASMLLSIAEINHAYRGAKKRQEALEAAREALDVLQSTDDAKLQALTHLMLACVHTHSIGKNNCSTKKEARDALDSAKEAASLFKKVQDKGGLARALHAQAISHAHLGAFLDADQCAKEAQNIFREMGNKKQEAFESYCMASWHLVNEKSREAVLEAQEAKTKFWELPNSKGWDVAALSMLVQALVASKDKEEAVKVTLEGQRRFQSSNNPRADAAVQDVLVVAYVAKDEKDLAMKAAEKAIQLWQSVGDKRSELHSHHVASLVYSMKENFSKAQSELNTAMKLANQIKSSHMKGEILITQANLKLDQDDNQGALSLAKEALAIFQDEGLVKQKAVAQVVISSAHGADGAILDSTLAAMDARLLFRREENKPGEIDVLELLWRLKQLDESHNAALRFMNKARLIAQEIGNQSTECRMLFHVIQSLLTLDMDEKVRIQQQEQALEAADEFSKGKLQAQGETPKPYNDKHLRAATTSADEADQLAKQENDAELIAHAKYWIARCLLQSGKTEEALEAAEDVLKEFQKLQSQGGEAISMHLIADAYCVLEKRSKAEEYANDALKLFKGLQDQNGEHAAQDILDFLAGTTSSRAHSLGGGGGDDAVVNAGLDPELVKARLLEVAGNAMGFADELSFDSPLMDAGMDSLAAVEFRNMLAREFEGINLPASLTFDYPTLNTISENVVEQSKSLPATSNPSLRAS